ncbi:tRNA uridine-5-carboxymethylaminomethyl(34) synthesis GTPase MnmE [Erythrobacter litoralis]|uniref:tRNA modification GTPase MnmE n=1 Tax=Erythrobacter litoralis (strain HTCC2594) TaxID=314225 RepID=MNME_ERYLH|nr:tRNA uridine-5-carboxymethylaminomethyl(34) synthesis GTPase MnmE [Erythrobacter litoralis]Q2N6I9.1 RecName: Full=tRNA modification GTPase MnmE [Erythrobacter litoralis HTCC2594]ABC64702.1 tRNA modification GTPase [Erythrobacter litoralis HTCC2594]
METIFALSSGAPPAAIGVIRISGTEARGALEALAGSVPDARKAALRRLRDGEGKTLDDALVLWLPGPDNATGEDCVELHCHGGRAVIAAIERTLGTMPGLRRAEPGEFTRRAFANGRIDLAEAEGLADLLFAETELQRQVLQASAGGRLSELVGGWRERVLALSAQVESALDFSDEDDVDELAPAFYTDVSTLADELGEWLERPQVERLRDGVRVVFAGPPNAGKSTLFNALLQSEAAIVSPIAGTTRDVLERPVAFGGTPFTLIDTAGLHEGGDDSIERIGIDRARAALRDADIVLWLGPEGEGPDNAWEIDAQSDIDERTAKSAPRLRLSAKTGEGIDALVRDLRDAARDLLPRPGDVAVNARQHALLSEAAGELAEITRGQDLLITAEHLRTARSAFDRFTGRATTEDMLDALFGRFCIGK